MPTAAESLIPRPPSAVPGLRAAAVGEDGTLRVRDRFTRPDSATTLGVAETGQAWAAFAGTWGVSGGRAYSATDGGTESVVLDAGVTDGVLACTISGTLVSATDFRLPTLVLRAIDVNNFLYVDWLQGAARINKIVAGSATTLVSGTAGLLDGVQYRARVAATGPLVTVSIDGAQKVAWTLSAADMAVFVGRTKWGLRLRLAGAPATAARWDDFEVRVP